MRKLDGEGEEEEVEGAFPKGDKQRRKRRRRWRRGEEANEMEGKRRHENGEIVSNDCEEEKLERMISESGIEGGKEWGKGSNEKKEGRGKEEGVKVGKIGGVESEHFSSLLLQWFSCWLAGYLGVAFPWILLVLILFHRSSLLFKRDRSSCGDDVLELIRSATF